MLDLTQPLPPLTPRQRLTFWIVAAVCAATRFLAMARSLWDWDEALFCLGMRAYDVTSHHPHPPGFPVYIAAGKVVRLFLHDNFRSLQAINLAAGVLLFPVVFLLARELRLSATTATIAGALCAFFPNVWFFGGGAFSDVPSIVLVVFAVALLLRGYRDGNAYLAGALLLALAAGIRPQNFLIGLAPGAIATWYRARRSWRDVVFAALLGAAAVGVAFGGAIAATGSYARYAEAIRVHGEYISRVDSFRSPGRPPLWRLVDRFFIKQYQSPALSIITSLFVIVSIGSAIRRRDPRMLLNALAFGPFAIAAWLMLDRYSVSRFSIGYAPMFAIFAADGISRVARGREGLEAAIGAALAGAFALWTLPALTSVRRDVSPPVLAVEAVRDHIDTRRDQLFVASEMTPFVEYLLPYVPFQRVLDERAMPMTAGARRPWLLAEVDSTDPKGFRFRRERGHLWDIARRHYFDVALAPVRALPQFASGWWPPERAGIEEWRWTAGHTVARLPPVSGPAILHLQFRVPVELLPSKPQVTVALNGAIIERWRAAEETQDREYPVQPAPNGAPNTLELSIERTVNPAGRRTGRDARDLGLQVRYLSWGPG
jgi:hypothetical protein